MKIFNNSHGSYFQNYLGLVFLHLNINLGSIIFYFPWFSAKCLWNKVRKAEGKTTFKRVGFRDFPGGTVVKNLPAKAGDTGSSPGPERSHVPQSN